MNTAFRTRLVRWMGELLMAISALAVFSGCATQQASMEGSNAPLAKARSSLAEARGDTPNSSDGVVPYWSSHLAGAESELIVPGPHGAYQLPQTVNELKRILRLNLAVAGPAPQRMASDSRPATLR